MSASDIKEIVYHCPCRRFVQGTPDASCTCHECGRVHVPTEEYRMSGGQKALSVHLEKHCDDPEIPPVSARSKNNPNQKNFTLKTKKRIFF